MSTAGETSRPESGRGWAVFLFHGVGGDYLQVSDAVHRDFIDWLSRHRQEVWVTTLQQALDWEDGPASKARNLPPGPTPIRRSARAEELRDQRWAARR